jgi:hypothetical protein
MMTDTAPMSLDEAIKFDKTGSYDLDETLSFADQPKKMPVPLSEWLRETIITEDMIWHRIVTYFATEADADRAVFTLNDLTPTLETYEQMEEKLKRAKVIITKLLLVLHDHSGSKQWVANEAREYLGLKPGARIGSWYDKLSVMYPHMVDNAFEL